MKFQSYHQHFYTLITIPQTQTPQKHHHPHYPPLQHHHYPRRHRRRHYHQVLLVVKVVATMITQNQINQLRHQLIQ